MTDSNEVPVDGDSESDDSRDSEIRGWLHGALDRDAAPHVDVLAGVQQKLRERSGGKFYADLWSTAKQPPVATFLVTALVMLAVILTAYAILAPLRGEPEVVPTRPEPVQVVSPAK
jgi:hypothetical protein